jgi:hypothetical protein
MKVLPLILVIALLACGMFTSCKKHINGPPDDTTHKCDTCCDTCKKDTTKPPCDTCNIDKDSAAHAFVWTEYINQIPGETNITGVWVFGPNDIIIIANSIYHFDGINFTVIPAYDNTNNNVTLNGAMSGYNIFAFSKIDYWLVHGSDVLHTGDGTYFRDYRPGSSNACWGSSPNDVFVVGNGGQIHHFDGTSFSQMTSNTTKDLGSVWGTSHNNVWATGWNSSKGETVLMHYDGTSWKEDELSTSGKINDYAIGTVWACDSAGVPIAVIAGTRVLHKTGNGIWRSDTSEVGNGLGGGDYIGIGAFGGTSTDIFAVGGWGFVSHWNGKTWHKYNSLFDYSNSDYGAFAFSMNGNTACGVGVKGGQGWVAIGRRK